MKHFKTFQVYPNIPESLIFLEILSRNIWWCWRPMAIELFQGKELIKRIISFARKAELRNRIIFLENYDMHIGRLMLQGADVWLNTPRRPFEACGTSGMKAAVNGVLNLSVLDGWWAEAYDEAYGWQIGNGRTYEDPDYQDSVENQDLYNLLEEEVIPAFYERRNGDAPEEVEVQIYYGHIKTGDTVTSGEYESMKIAENLGNGDYLYDCHGSCKTAGRFGFTTRVVPAGDEWIRSKPGLITWN
jgi:hypothetical protein